MNNTNQLAATYRSVTPPPYISYALVPATVSVPGIFFDPCPTGDLLGGALSAVRAQCNYLDV